MADSYVDKLVDVATNEFDFTFPYLETNDIRVKYNATVISVDNTTIITSPSTKIQVFTDSEKGTPYNAIADTMVRVYRETDTSPAKVDFVDGSVLTGDDLDTSVAQLLYMGQESYDRATVSLQLDSSDPANRWDAESKIVGKAADAENGQDLVTKSQLETTIGEGVLSPQLVHFDTDTSAIYTEGNTSIQISSFQFISDVNKRVICTVGGVIQRPDTDFEVENTLTNAQVVLVGVNFVVDGKLKYPVSCQIPF